MKTFELIWIPSLARLLAITVLIISVIMSFSMVTYGGWEALVSAVAVLSLFALAIYTTVVVAKMIVHFLKVLVMSFAKGLGGQDV